MSVSIHFKCQGLMYSLMMKTSVEKITLSMVEARIFKKLALGESEATIRLTYNALLVGSGDPWTITDDEDMQVYLSSINKESRRCILYVEVITNLEEPVQVSIKEVDGSKSKPDGIVSCDEGMDNGIVRSDMGDEYVEPPPVVEASQYVEPWEDGLGLSLRQEFPNKKTLQDVVNKGAFVLSFGFVIKKSDPVRLVLKCTKDLCKWGLRAAKVRNTDIFLIRRYTKMHTCSRASQSRTNNIVKRHGTPKLVAPLLHDHFPGKTETPTSKMIMDLVKTKLGVNISYSTALRGKNQAITDLRGSSEDSYKMLYCYLHILEKVNEGTITCVELDEKERFKNLFIALGASIEGFQVMRKVIIVDASWLKNGYGGVLIFASAPDPNRHHYPIAFGILDGEKDESWTWFLEMLKTVIPDTFELVFISDRNARLIGDIANVYPQARHGYCIWHLSQNVKSHVSNVNKDVVAWRLMELSRQYIVANFNSAYIAFNTRYLSAAAYLEESTVNEKWSRCYFPGERYNLDTSSCVESMNNVFKDAKKYSLIPLLDTIIVTFSRWFNDHRKDSMARTIEKKLVPLVENILHKLWPVAEKLIVTELNSFELEYNVIDCDGKPYFVNLLQKSCSCKVFNIERYPCLHAVASFIEFLRHDDRTHEIQLHELCSKYYWTELWVMAYYRTIYLVLDRSQWDVLDETKNKKNHTSASEKQAGKKES